MRTQVHLTVAFIASVLVHLALAYYLHETRWQVFEAGGLEGGEKYVEVELIPEFEMTMEAPREDLSDPSEPELTEILKKQAESVRVRAKAAETQWNRPPSELELPIHEGLPKLAQGEDPVTQGTPEVASQEVLQLPGKEIEAPLPEAREAESVEQAGFLPPPVEVASAPFPATGLAIASISMAPPSTVDIPLPPVVDVIPDIENSQSVPVEIPDIQAPLPAEETNQRMPLPGDVAEYTSWDELLEVVIDTYRPPKGQGYFRITILPNSKAKDLKPMSKDVLLAVDASGSVNTEGFKKVQEAILQSLSMLQKGDRFNITGFRAEVVALNSGLWPVTPEALAEAESFLKNLEPSGKTDIYLSVSAISRSLPPGDRPFFIILISDGHPTVGLQDSRAIINRLTQENNLRSSIHVFGLGPNANQYLLRLLAYRNKGMIRFAEDPDQIAGELKKLLHELSGPILLDTRADLGGGLNEECYPKVLPDLFQSGKLEIFGRYDKETEILLRLAGHVRGKYKEMLYRGRLPEPKDSNSGITRQWGMAKAYDLITQNCIEGDSPERTASIRQLSGTYQLNLPSN